MSLNLSYNDLSHAIIKDVSLILKKTNLKELKLSGNKLGSTGVSALSKSFLSTKINLAKLELA